MVKTKIIYIHVGLSSFVEKDIKILSESFELKIFHFKLTEKKKLPFVFIHQLGFLLLNLFTNKACVIQFGGYQSYLPTLLSRLYRRKAIIIMGGTDSVSFPSIQYGCFYNKYLKYFTRKSLQYASLLLPVSENLIECDYSYTKDDFPKQGYKFHAPKVKTESKVIYNGYDSKKWEIGSNKEELSFLTIGANLGSRFGKLLKGIDLIIELAPKFPQATFYIVGGDKLKDVLPANVKAIGNMPHEDLPKFINSKMFYLQLSMSEGFPNALCEAMLCGCIPIVSNVGAMPTIVSNDGYILNNKSLAALTEVIRLAIISTNHKDQAENARKRIADNFTLTRRTEELNSTISQHLQK